MLQSTNATFYQIKTWCNFAVTKWRHDVKHKIKREIERTFRISIEEWMMLFMLQHDASYFALFLLHAERTFRISIEEWMMFFMLQHDASYFALFLLHVCEFFFSLMSFSKFLISSNMSQYQSICRDSCAPLGQLC